MAKTYYADYVNHILRFYFRYDIRKGFKNAVDKANYIAADKVVKKISNAEQDLLCAIFSIDNINVADNVLAVATRRNEDPTKIWAIVSTTTTKVAKERGLL